MYSFNARRNETSPNRMSLERHSCRMEPTQRSEKAFRFGLLGGRANGRTPLDRRTSKNAIGGAVDVHRGASRENHTQRYVGWTEVSFQARGSLRQCFGFGDAFIGRPE